VVLSAFIAIASAAPSGLIAAPLTYAAPYPAYSYAAIAPATKTIVYEPELKAYHGLESVVVDTPTVAHVGSVRTSIPTAVSHQSSTIVHSKADIVEPILAHGIAKSVISTPVTKFVSEPVARTYIQPTLYAAPYAGHFYAGAAPAHITTYAKW
jgi:Drosophila Retinin like protein